MPHYSTFTLLDHSNEKSSVQVYNGSITALTIGAFLTQFAALRNAIDGITLGTIHKEKWTGDDTLLSNVLPANEFAQRELKWLVKYRNIVNNGIFTLEVPTADPTGRLLPGSDVADLTETNMAAFVTAFETIARTPDNDIDGTDIMEVRLVGRNL